METIGAYAFVTNDWKEKDFPLDLWVKWHLPLFDKISIVTYGKFDVPGAGDPKLIINSMEPVGRDTFEFYTKGKLAAQHYLDTDWKMIVDIDEFIKERVNTEGLDKRKAYAIRFHHLYGNPYTEIMNPAGVFENKFVLHYGNRDMARRGAGAGVVPPYAARMLVINSIRSYLDRIFKIDDHPPRFKATKYIDLYHTNRLRDPSAFSEKFKEEIIRMKNENSNFGGGMLKYTSDAFDYRMYKEIFPGCYLLRVNKEDLPQVIIDNEKRFTQAAFEDSEYRALKSSFLAKIANNV